MPARSPPDRGCSPGRCRSARYAGSSTATCYPNPAKGPDEETIEGSSFEVRLRGTGASEGYPGGFAVEATVRGDRDPGYGSTCRMLGESAVCLARGEVESPHDGGVLTPASGIGLPLIDRLEGTGVSFEVETVEGGD
ncbi:hypothetical protein [Halobaculum sp. EA56]|uniref:hypothetical protein n=1 Tax=Halobaculum sp. EA56 TaxID=3421648 RepID=UPI003EBAC736